MTSFHQHFDIDRTGLTHNKFRAASYSSFGANRPIKQLGIVGICPVVDRTLFDTSLADFLEERLAQLKAWQSKLPVPGAPLQPSGIKRQIASLSASLSDLVGLHSDETSTALERLRQVDEVFLYMQTALGFVDPDYLGISGHPTFSVGSQVHSGTNTGLIFREGTKWSLQVIASPDIILAATATEHPYNSLKDCIVETANVRPVRESRVDRLVDIYSVELQWAALMRKMPPAYYHCVQMPGEGRPAARVSWYR